MKTILDVHDLTKTFGTNTVLDHISFSISRGSCYGLLGPNGAGKSTTMKLLTGILETPTGSIKILGHDAAKARDMVQKVVGYVPQEITLYEKLSAEDNLTFFGGLYGLKGKQLKERIRTVLTDTGLLDRANDLVKTFSGGMKRRINIACTLLHEPQILILDEPTVGIDPQSRNHIFGMIRRLRDAGVTIIYSTHYMEEVEALCDELAILDHGKMIAQGPLSDILDRFSQKAVYIEDQNVLRAETYPAIKRITPHHQGLILECDQPLSLMRQLLDDAAAGKIGPIHAIELMKPSLEDVFLSLTGTRLRDE